MRLTIITALLIFTVSCGATTGPNDQSAKPTITVPQLPALISDPVEISHWFAHHYWDSTNVADTAFRAHPEVLTTAMMEWGTALKTSTPEVIAAVVPAFFDKVAADTALIRITTTAAEQIFYSGQSPIRNFEAYIAVLEWIVACPSIDPASKIRPQAQLELVLKNRIGTKANNFHFITLDNKPGSLYNTKARYTIIFIYEPGCPACKQYGEELVSSPTIEQHVTSGDLQIIALYTDRDEKQWRDYASQIPAHWINGYDRDHSVVSEQLYETNVTPTLLLLDEHKNVIMKDVKADEIEAFLMY